MKIIRLEVAAISTVLFLSFMCGGQVFGASIVLFSAGLETILDSGDVERPRMNNAGEVVWTRNLTGSIYGIYSSTGGLVHSGDATRDPDINDSGEIIWRFGDGGQGPNGIASNTRGVIFSSSGQDPYYDTARITNTGEIIAARHGGQQTWSSVRGNLPTYGLFDRELEVNDLGEVVATSYYGPNGNVIDIYSTERGAITNDALWQREPDINGSGEIVWEQFDPQTSSRSKIWSNTRGFLGFGTSPSVNDYGEVVWSYNGDIFSSLRGQLTSGSDNDLDPFIANNGDIAFRRSGVFVPQVSIPTSLALFLPAIISLWCLGRNCPTCA